jgi:hypothetical protein
VVVQLQCVTTADEALLAAEAICDVLGCPATAAKGYVDARQGRFLDFRICDSHFARLAQGAVPSVLPAPASRTEFAVGRPGLILPLVSP